MPDAWQILRDGGVPIVGPTTGARPSLAALASSVRTSLAGARGRDAEALAAWLLAWRAHWPSSFAATFAEDLAAIVEWATAHATDPNRYLKLRRIAIETLATVL
jgi:hypothetical protein